MTESLHEPAQHDHPTFCATHPATETSLRCNRCEKFICPKCAKRTPIGYRCEDCVRGQQKVFDTAQAQDYVLVTLIAGVLSFIGSLIVPTLGFFTIFLAPGVGAVIAGLIRRATNRRRSKRLFQWAATATAIGSLLPLCVSLFGIVFSLFVEGAGAGFGLFGLNLIWQGIYTFMVTSSTHYRLSGIQI
ncbi:MAG: hypothetical protein ACE5GO_02360 [Anaerolineales bacterium]